MGTCMPIMLKKRKKGKTRFSSPKFQQEKKPQWKKKKKGQGENLLFHRRRIPRKVSYPNHKKIKGKPRAGGKKGGGGRDSN